MLEAHDSRAHSRIDRLESLVADLEHLRGLTFTSPLAFDNGVVRLDEREPQVMLALTRGAISGREFDIITVATLDGGITSSQDSIPLSSVLAVQVGDVLVIDNENVYVRKVDAGGSTVTVDRGINDTAYAAHDDGTLVYKLRSTLGVGDVFIYELRPKSDGGWDLENSWREETAYNPCPTPIADDMLCLLFREPNSALTANPGKLLAIPLCALTLIPGGFDSGSDSGSEPGVPCGPCASTSHCYEVTFTGVIKDPDTCEPGCSIFNDTFRMLGTCPLWVSDAMPFCGSYLADVKLGYDFATNTWELDVHATSVFGGGGNFPLAIYTVDADEWDCQSPVVMTKTFEATGICESWPETVTVEPCSGGTGGSEPTVDFSDANLCDDATEVTITGTNFIASPANSNIVTFNLGATGTVTAATTTSLTVVFDTPPSSLGALTAVVENANGSSAPAVQIATVVACDGQWHDTFTDTNGTELDSHTPDVGTSYTEVDAAAPLEIQGNKLTPSAASLSSTYSFNDSFGDTDVTTVKFTINTKATDFQYIVIAERFTDLNNSVSVSIAGNNTGNWTLSVIKTEGVPSVLDSAPVTIDTITVYTLTITKTPTAIAATLGAASVSGSTTFNNTVHTKAIGMSAGDAGAGCMTIDDLEVQ